MPTLLELFSNKNFLGMNSKMDTYEKEVDAQIKSFKDDNIQEKIEEQIKTILSKKGITDYSIQFCDGKRKLILKIKGSCNKCICISYENFTDSQILADDPKWLKCLNCKITCGIAGCSKKMQKNKK